MEEQVELDFTIKAEVPVMQKLVEELNANHLVKIVSVENETTVGPVFLYIPHGFTPVERWEYKVSTEPVWSTPEHVEEWLNKLGEEGWEILRIPEDAEGFWYFRKKTA